MKSRWLGAIGLVLILGVAVFVWSCKDKSTNPGGGGTPADLTIGIVGNNGTHSYFPDTATVTVGQRVAWHNADGTTHTATGNGGIPAFDTNNVGAGSTSASIQMNNAGNFPYHCKIHGLTMSGVLIVTP